MLSLTCKTAIKATIYLSGKNGEKTSIKEISGRINASEHTVGKILQQLAKKRSSTASRGHPVDFTWTMPSRISR